MLSVLNLLARIFEDMSECRDVEPLKIAIICGAFPTVTETFILNDIVELLGRGHDVRIFSLKRPANHNYHGAIDRHKLLEKVTYALPSNAPKRLRSYYCQLFLMVSLKAKLNYKVLYFLCKLIGRRSRVDAISLIRLFDFMITEKQPFDIVHAHFGGNAMVYAELKREFCFLPPLVTTFHGYDVLKLPSQRPSGWYGLLARYGSHFTVPTDFLSGVVRDLGFPQEKLTKLPNSVSPDSFAHKVHDACSDGITLLTVARLVEGKGHKYAIHALSELIQDYPNIRYVVAGGGPEADRLSALAGELGVDKNIDFLGPITQEEMPNVYIGADIFVLPSIILENGWQENQGVVLLEAQASGLPVVATRTGGIPEGVLEGETAVLVNPANGHEIAQAVVKLIRNRDRWSEMGEKGQRFVRERFDLKNNIAKLESIYHDLIKDYSGHK